MPYWNYLKDCRQRLNHKQTLHVTAHGTVHEPHWLVDATQPYLPTNYKDLIPEFLNQFTWSRLHIYSNRNVVKHRIVQDNGYPRRTFDTVYHSGLQTTTHEPNPYRQCHQSDPRNLVTYCCYDKLDTKTQNYNNSVLITYYLNLMTSIIH